ncbi:uncharacterized protein FFM5_15316 [Fusarium fujikuroi]|nr:uncharacterized protein FFM5_15316 [Fusarium fujikuroi]
MAFNKPTFKKKITK